MSGDGKTPGNGSTSPFGNGQGGLGSGGDMAQQNAGPQKTGPLDDINTESVAPGGKVVHADAKPTLGDVGCGSIGNPQKPFKLTGEGASASDAPEAGSTGDE
jgi:hypothetical protein